MDPSDEAMTDGAAAGRRARLRVALGVAAGLAALAVGAGWIERRPIVARFVARELGGRHVPASYRIAALGPFAQRLEDVRIGNPAHPDLVAKAIDLRLGYTLSGPHLVAVRAEGVRLAARVVDGRLSLGAIDRLLPKTSGAAPMALPDLAVTLADTRVALATPAGVITARVSGDGNLSDGFRGRIVATSDGLRAAGCAVARPAAMLDVRIADRKPAVSGPLDLAALACGPRLRAGAGRATLDLAFAASLDRWTGGVALAGFAGEGGGARFGALNGRVGVSGGVRRMEGDVALASASVAASAGNAGRAGVTGRYRYDGPGGLVFAGDVALDHAALSAGQRRRIVTAAQGLGATPLGPLAARAAAAADQLLTDADARGTLAVAVGGPAGTFATLRALDLAGHAGGGHIRIVGGQGIGWTAKGWRVDGRLTSGGGSLPALDVQFAQATPGGAIDGVARLDPYAAAGARLAMTPARFTWAVDGGTRFETVAMLDGPIGSGRIEGLSVPLAGRIDSRGGFVLGARCVPVGFRSLTLSGVVLDPARLTVCGLDGAAIVARRGGRVGAGVALANTRLTGRSGSAPLTIAAASLRIAPTGLAGEGIDIALGPPERRTRLTIPHLAGAAIANGFGGSFADTSGAIANVPLLLTGAAGNWRLAGGVLDVTGSLSVADAETASPRFQPLAARGVALRLAGGRISGGGVLHEPKSGALVSDVTVRHDLASGTGGAVLDVPGLAFAPKGLQPEALTPLTLGVIANVAGTVAGRGVIDWDARGVASSGDFRTEGIDLAAAFGPVRRIVGAVHFSNLLGMVTPPHQAVTVAEVNPGIAVTDGIAHYQFVGGNRVQVEDARWPFAGGTLRLEPSLLGFGVATERHLTFRVDGLDAAAFVQQLDFPNIAATGTFDGVLPMIFDDSGGRIAKGLLTARAGGGTLAYVGELTNAQLGAMGKLAFDALKAIRYRSLSIGLDGKLDGEIVSLVKFEGVRQATGDAGMVAKMIYNLPFRFNIAIRAPFRGLMGSARSYADPNLLLSSGLLPPAAIQPPAIQPPESETVR